MNVLADIMRLVEEYRSKKESQITESSDKPDDIYHVDEPMDVRYSCKQWNKINTICPTSNLICNHFHRRPINWMI